MGWGTTLIICAFVLFVIVIFSFWWSCQQDYELSDSAEGCTIGSWMDEICGSGSCDC